MATVAATLSGRFAQPADKRYYQRLEIAVDSGDYQNLSYLYACCSWTEQRFQSEFPALNQQP